MKGARRTSREVALQVLFQYNFSPEIDLKQCLALYENHFLRDNESWKYAESLIQSAIDNHTAIDKIISDISKNWKLDRIAPVDLNILRVAITEIKFLPEPTPRKVAINEAIEIAKKFGSENSASFINGILDQV